MNSETVTAATPLVRLVRFEHERIVPHRDPPEESCDCFSVNFVESGSFRVMAEGRDEEFRPGMLFVTRPGLSYRCRHREEFPGDVCLSVQFSECALAGEVRGLDRGPAVRPSNRIAYARLRLLSRSWGDPLAFEVGAMELVLAVAETGSETPSRLYRPEQLAWLARRVDRIREMLEASYADPLPLASLAREAGMSLFHFARIFGELTGTPPHRYLTGIRLRHARRLLEAGRGVTETCYDVGFSSLSHFTRQFRRAFGVTPSRLRARP
jgi:AraC family transcriptional regulator